MQESEVHRLAKKSGFRESSTVLPDDPLLIWALRL